MVNASKKINEGELGRYSSTERVGFEARFFHPLPVNLVASAEYPTSNLVSQASAPFGSKATPLKDDEVQVMPMFALYHTQLIEVFPFNRHKFYLLEQSAGLDVKKSRFHQRLKSHSIG